MRLVPRTAILAMGAALAVPATVAAQRATSRGVDTAGMDTSVRPGNDFYRYANGGWERRTEIPPDRGSYTAFSVTDDRAQAQLTELVRSDAAARGGTGEPRQIGDYYTAFLDTMALARRALTPIRPLLDSIAALGDRVALARFLGAHLRADVDVLNLGALHTDNLFGLWVDADFNHPTRYAAMLLQGGIAMPDRSYYLDASPKMADVRAAYRAHVARTLALAGRPDAAASADAIIALETRIAQAHWTQEDSWEPTKGNNHWARADFRAGAPGLDWDTFFRAAQLADVDTIVAWQPSAITGLSALVASQPLESWKELLAYHELARHAAVLSPALDREAFAFYGETLGGAPQQAVRAQRALDATSAALGFAVGHQYVERYFSPSAKARAQRMVTNIIQAFDRRIEGLTWMAPATKAEARAKLRTLRVSIAYPDRWPSYAALRVSPDDAYGNAERVVRFQYERSIADLRRPMDRAAWAMTPQMVNAVNMPQRNALNFPAAILQPPFFDPARSDAVNYGAMGTVIGHEVSHSFDNIGAGFDAQSRLRNWWTTQDFAHFTDATGQLARQYDSYRPFPDLGVNGKLTLAEDIADLAGITASHDAWRASLGSRPAPVIDGLTGEQQFFLGFAQIWRAKFRDPALRRSLLTNGHAPGAYRALTVRNLDAWYDAFGVQPGDSLYLAPSDRVRIW